MTDATALDVNLQDLAGKSKEEFADSVQSAAREAMKNVIESTLEREMDVFCGAAWHERNPEKRVTSRAGCRRRRYTVFWHDVVLRVQRARKLLFAQSFCGG